MKSKKSLLVLSVMASIGAMAISCSGGAGAADVDVPLTGEDPTREVTIKFWHCLGHDKEGNLDAIVDAFNTKWAGKYKVVLTKIAGSYDALADGVKTKLSASEIPALCMGYPDSFSTYMGQRISESALIRLDNFINDTEYGYGYSAEELADFVPAFYQEGTNYQFEGTWSMPMYKSTEIMYYNMNYFYGDNKANAEKFHDNAEFKALQSAIKAAAANPTDKQLTDLKTWVQAHNGYVYNVPTTWEEMVTVCTQMKADLAKEGLNAPFYPMGYDSDANLLISQFAMRGIPYTTNENITKASDHILFNNQNAKDFVTSVVDLYSKGLFISKGLLGGSKYTNDYFTAEECAMTVGSTGGSSYNVASSFRVGLAPVPTPEGKDPLYIQQGPSICFFNNDNDFIHKGAWLFYKEMASTTNNAKLALQNSYDPIRESSFKTSEYTSWISKKDKGLNYAIPAETASLRAHYMTSPVFLGSDAARSNVGEILASVIAQGKTVDEAFQDAYNKTVSACRETYNE